MTEQPVAAPRIVVGFDGSKSSAGALEWAATQAERMHGTLTIVTAWEWPIAYGTPIPFPQEFDPKVDAQALVDDAENEVRHGHRGLALDTIVERGRPAAVLVRASRDASLLVVGSRGHGGFVGLTLGSVSQSCVSAAHCPVLVFRGP